ncbi:hypothetical protein KJ863_00135 [Patescibacteria group bacterium]|nr:hypothetical protein [Candidatus Falkowbacteria bacterium]MBU3906332.1 hypothetical protein [Patescibacteria group bacterium]MBU4072517.1 hypothetical protein [Patescibacteria group bacterium]MBU4102627.1 hypothetical protein [Patescibacteria group bacterium]MBU4125849.1 hypothetical protein [Patescibacteria group bacterium]
MNYQKQLKKSAKELIVSFDLEWTKNYKIKNGNKPFCFSYIFFEPFADIAKTEKYLEFGLYLCYCENEDDISSLIKEANKILGKFFNMRKRMTMVGHQLSSDIAVMLKCDKKNKEIYFSQLKTLWRNRKEAINKEVNVFDSRYDLNFFLKGKSRRLVDICEERRLDVVQPELKFSMTKMQNDFYSTGNKEIMEKLSVLNIRHSLSTAILFLLSEKNSMPKKSINVNRILYRNLKDIFSYARSKEFKKLL